MNYYAAQNRRCPLVPANVDAFVSVHVAELFATHVRYSLSYDVWFNARPLLTVERQQRRNTGGLVCRSDYILVAQHARALKDRVIVCQCVSKQFHRISQSTGGASGSQYS